MSLLDMLANIDLNRRHEMIDQYWMTFQAWAEYRLAIDQNNWLNDLGQPRDEISRLTLDAARSSSNDSVSETELALNRQQATLNDFIVGPYSEVFPLPTDQPIVGTYRTNLEDYVNNPRIARETRTLDKFLPRQHQLIADRADTVQRCRYAVIQAQDGYRNGTIPLSTLLHTIELCRSNHSGFVGSVIQYNTSISKYALTVQPNQTAPETIASMLIPLRNTSPHSPNRDSIFQDQRPERQANLGRDQGSRQRGSIQGQNNQRLAELPQQQWGQGAPSNTGLGNRSSAGNLNLPRRDRQDSGVQPLSNPIRRE